MADAPKPTHRQESDEQIHERHARYYGQRGGADENGRANDGTERIIQPHREYLEVSGLTVRILPATAPEEYSFSLDLSI